MQLSAPTILISIVIPFYNAKDCIERLFVSLADYAQRDDVEILIVDDCSATEHTDALKQHVSQLQWSHLRLILCDKNGGAAMARKRGIEHACGEFIAFLDSDDAWARNKLDAQVDAMRAHNAAISGCACEQISTAELTEVRTDAVATYGVSQPARWQALFNNPYSTPTVMMTRAAALAQPFSDTLRYSEDVDCWRRVLLTQNGIVLQGPNAYMFKHAFLSDSGSLSSFTLKMSLGQLQSLGKLLFNSSINWRYRLLVPIALVWAGVKALRRELLVIRARQR
ncbi:glycosyltransferase family 2 protein [Alteromonas flava]|uniref:glycosyltransferase family 2 protein n=1 Tax=Alteromonas flava TaxID=2048003 RepID=UPI000C281A1B|nr:glycosyltransferase family 2 protein [Alteromonas flava]